MQTRDTTRIVGLLGYPVAHSLSPAMHNAGFAHCGIDAAYVLMPVPPADLPAAVAKLRDPKYLGANVTLPHKQAACALVDERSDLSEKMGVVNTIVNRGGRLFGDTTDPIGFLRNFTEAGHSFDRKSVLILGNGGSARTIAFALFLMAAPPTRVALGARDHEKSQVLVTEIAEKTGHVLEALGPVGLASSSGAKVGEFDIVVNATPVGMRPSTGTLLSKDWLQPHQIVYDIVYNPEETRLLLEAKDRGCQTVGGLGMLIHQGLASFELWTAELPSGKQNPGAAVFYEGIRRQGVPNGEPTR